VSLGADFLICYTWVVVLSAAILRYIWPRMECCIGVDYSRVHLISVYMCFLTNRLSLLSMFGSGLYDSVHVSTIFECQRGTSREPFARKDPEIQCCSIRLRNPTSIYVCSGRCNCSVCSFGFLVVAVAALNKHCIVIKCTIDKATTR
jgi:hypothetical protein